MKMLSYLGHFSSSIHIPHSFSFLIKNLGGKVQVNMELKMVEVESHKINGEKIVLYLTSEKNCLLWKGLKKSTYNLGVEKSLITKKTHSPPPPCIKWSTP